MRQRRAMRRAMRASEDEAKKNGIEMKKNGDGNDGAKIEVVVDGEKEEKTSDTSASFLNFGCFLNHLPYVVTVATIVD